MKWNWKLSCLRGIGIVAMFAFIPADGALAGNNTVTIYVALIDCYQALTSYGSDLN
jgi:hypothetical protein